LKHAGRGQPATDPPGPDQGRADQHQLPDPEAIDQRTGQRNRPGFEQHEDRENQRDIRIGNSAELLLHAGREQREAILVVRQQDHDHHAAGQHAPALAIGRFGHRRRDPDGWQGQRCLVRVILEHPAIPGLFLLETTLS
jgi:hypothetical protein